MRKWEMGGKGVNDTEPRFDRIVGVAWVGGGWTNKKGFGLGKVSDAE
jgi:hypothetical protein